MSKIESQAIVQRVTLGNRVLDIQRTTWTYTDGLSFDVLDVETGLCLTPESLDEWPSVQVVADLIDQLRDDLDSGALDYFFDGSEGELAAIVCDHPDQYVNGSYLFQCPDCGQVLGR
jgi:hypothetical protein